MSDTKGAVKKNDKAGLSKAALLFFAVTAALCVLAAALIGANGEGESKSSSEQTKIETLSAQRFIESAKNTVSFTDAGSDAESNTYTCKCGEFDGVLMLSLRSGEVRSFTLRFPKDAMARIEDEGSSAVLDLLDDYSSGDEYARYTSDMRTAVETFMSAMDTNSVLLKSDREMLSGLVIETMEDAKKRDARVGCYDFCVYTQEEKLLAVMKLSPEGNN